MQLHSGYSLIMMTHSGTVLLSKTAIEQLLLNTTPFISQMIP